MFCPKGVGRSFIILSIQLSATETSYTISDRYDVGFGYRYMDLKYEKERLDLDMTTYGPVVGMNIRF